MVGFIVHAASPKSAVRTEQHDASVEVVDHQQHHYDDDADDDQ